MKQNRTRDMASGQATAPVLRLRELALGIVLVASLIACPLLLVARQSYIANLSVRESRLSDSLSSVGRRCAEQRLYNEKLSSTARIESIMRQRGLEYPAAGSIVVIREPAEHESTGKRAGNIFAIIKKPFLGEKG